MRSIIKILALICALVSCSCASRPQFRLIHDDDGDSNWDFKHLTVEKIDSAVALVAGTGVTSFAICTGSDYVHYGSQYADSSFLKDSGLKERGVDFIRTVLVKAREHGMEPIVTHRMNDLHFTSLTDESARADFFMSKWWHEHPEFWINEDFGWHTEGAYDFAHKEVRDRKVAIMTEQLEMYGDVMDVYLMDFLRFFCYFKQGRGRSHTAEMTDMVRCMRAVTDSIGKAKGHKILLAARVAPVNDNNLDQGLDVRQWLKEGLVDFLTLGIHMIVDSNMPVARFRDELGGDLNVPVYACGCNTAYWINGGYEDITDGMIRGFCSSVLAQGADGLQSFNFYFGQKAINDGISHEAGKTVNRVFHPSMYKELVSGEKLEGRNKIYWLSKGNGEYGLTPDTVLPLSVAPGGEGEAFMFVGDKMKESKPEEVILFFRTDTDIPVAASLNGIPSIKEEPSYPELYDRITGLEEGQRQWAYVFPADAVRHGDNVIRFKSLGNAPVKILRTEIALKYGPVEECGYF